MKSAICGLLLPQIASSPQARGDVRGVHQGDHEGEQAPAVPGVQVAHHRLHSRPVHLTRRAVAAKNAAALPWGTHVLVMRE
eukprot:789488-Prorocentrum_minimum.AAC.1